MRPDSLFLLFVAPLNAAGIRYMVTGSVASTMYGEPRLTHDIDLVVACDDRQLVELAAAFPDDGYYCPPIEIMRLEAHRASRGHFNIIHHESGFKADIYPVGRDPFLRWGLENALTVPLGDEPVRLAPPEYVIIKKLEYFREGGSYKHLDDIRHMLRESSALIDGEQLARLVAQFGLQGEWAQVRG
jgi:hypothetical protein